MTAGASLSLLDWRRRVFAIYAAVRAADDPEAGHRLWCAERDILLAEHPDSPISDRTRFTGVPVAPYAPDLRFEVRLDTDVPSERREVPTGTDGIVPFERLGVVTLPDLGRLDVWWLAAYGGGLFVPVKDALAGSLTYGGGRYLIDTIKGADLGGDVRGGRLVLDFNFAYNPSCAYDPSWACPLAGPGNTLSAPLPVGELMPSDHA
jgi:uncharacterized protein (DUF1684 family)